MLKSSTFLLNLLLLAGDALASPSAARTKRSTSYAVKDKHYVPQKWSKVARAPKDHVIELSIGLKSKDFDKLERQLYQVSDPSHKKYGQHLSSEQVNHLVKPADETLNLVHEWLAEHNIIASDLKYSSAKDWISVSLPVQDIESLLDTEYSVYTHEDGDSVVRTQEWSLPEYLHEHIQAIQPTNSFFRPFRQRKNVKVAGELEDAVSSKLQIAASRSSRTQAAADACVTDAVTPLCLRTLYGTLNYTVQVPGQNKVGLTNFLGETNNRSDVALFLQQYRPEAVAAAKSFKISIIAGGDNQQTQLNASLLDDGYDMEGNLDAETILGLSYPTPLHAYNTGGSPPFTPDLNTPDNTNEPYLVWLQYMLGQSDIPQVISTSYGDDEQTVPYSYAVKVCQNLAQLSARGVTLLYSSGDAGVGSNDTCVSNDGKNTATFLPSFPDSCPYVTSVGGTRNINPEIVAYDDKNGYVGGGGFSNYFATPSYQKDVVAKYVKSLGTQFKGLYNASGRAYPDIAAQGFRYVTTWNGTSIKLDGTSASSPCAAGVITLVNDALLAAGKPVLGFLNPWLYTVGYKSFTDITIGSAVGCNTAGFPAQKGWDAVTGFGTPYFPKFSKAAIAAAK